ncbi:hypothetical protein [Microbacterium hydrocarbonoxydans]|uniref:hypothetical protein n=1 Tax=Microbacterium hydrocarbonoxydans TaxID=273678 RepID=UPI0007BAF532|nr:hypothetical protein [Microbacterium hydrocarbonoxydans]GAT73488.1 hypothetical protein MHM582_1982 [Microbacterium sp. HM58-2]
MLLSERVREIGADQSDLAEDTVQVARQALLQEVARTGRPDAVRRRRRTWTGIGLGGLVAGAAVTAIVIGSVVAPVDAPPASAADVLNATADVVVDVGEITIPAGSYLRVTTTNEGLRFWDADMPSGSGEGWERFNNGNRADAEAALLSRGTSTLYVPADRTAEWVRVDGPRRVEASYGDRADEARADAAKDPSLAPAEADSTVRAAGGEYAIADGVDGVGTVTAFLDSRKLWAEMPTEPEKLLAWLRVRVGEPADSAASDSSIVETLIDDPSFALAPADVRAAALRTLALLDGSSVTAVDGDVTTIRFTWTTEWWSAWRSIEIDTARGLIVGTTSSGAITGEASPVEGLPAWESRTAYDIRIVDSAP